MKKISIVEISKLAGVSTATVSRVINGNGRFSKETEQRVLKVIKENNFAPNLQARSLRTKKVQTIGIIVPDITNEFFAKITLELQKRFFDMDYSTIICNTNEIFNIEQRHLYMLKSQNVSGVVYISGERADNKEILSGVPTVYIDRKPPFSAEKNYVLIESDNVQGGYLATHELIQKGCQKIVIMLLNKDLSSYNGRLEGYQKALAENGLELDAHYILKLETASVRAAFTAMQEFISNGTPFDGVFCATDLIAIGALKALDHARIRVPQIVKVIGFDNISITENNYPSVSTVRQSVEDFGAVAVSALMSIIDGKEPEKKHFILPVDVVRRETT